MNGREVAFFPPAVLVGDASWEGVDSFEGVVFSLLAFSFASFDGDVPVAGVGVVLVDDGVVDGVVEGVVCGVVCGVVFGLGTGWV